jgi:MinD-like ATPase involved in chromosome partitioning or flagellar assembly
LEFSFISQRMRDVVDQNKPSSAANKRAPQAGAKTPAKATAKAPVKPAAKATPKAPVKPAAKAGAKPVAKTPAKKAPVRSRAASAPAVEVAPEVLLLDEIKDSLFAETRSIVIGEAIPASTPEVSLSTSQIVIPTSTGDIPAIKRVDDEDDNADDFEMPSRRGRVRGEVSNVPEPVTMLTPDRILTPTKERPAPEGFLRNLLYQVSFHTINVGDSAKVRERKALDALIGAKIDGSAKFVPVLTRKGGVGKTTTTTLLGMALARVREDRVIAIDANPDRGTLAERFQRTTNLTVRDVVNRAPAIRSFNDFSEFVSRDKSRLDVLASDTDPLLSEAFDEADYNVVANLVERFYSIALTDCGTGIIHSVMKATLDRADGLVIVSGGSFDEARLAAETLTWLESNGYKRLVRGAIVALNTATQGTQLVNLDEIESHFRSRVRDIVRIPYDAQLAAGSHIDFESLKPLTRESARQLAALVVDGLLESN